MVDLRQYRQLHTIRMIADIIRKWWNLELAFADAKGYVLDHADGKIFPSGNEFCRQALFSKEGFRRCNESVKVVRDRLRGARRRGVMVHECHLGFDIVAAPIHFDSDLVGFVFTGGAVHEELGITARDELVRKVREFAPFDSAQLDTAVANIPRMTAPEREHLADLIEMGARVIMNVHRERNRTGTRERRRDAEANASASPFPDLVGNAGAMRDVYDLLEKIVRSESTVLIHGESGTGKELIARAIHFHGPRAKQPFVIQNCSAFNDNLLESALFGHVRGAFTGAVKDQKGLFEVADGGTFFLDEIGDMSPALQVKLLRVLQEGTFTPVGATKPVKVDVRIIAASHKDLTKMADRGEFREDLYYRINVLRVNMPPLRDRLDDLPMLVDHFLAKHYRGEGQPPRLSAAALEALASYKWPGNIRELENEVERLLVLGVDEAEIGPELLSERIRQAQGSPKPKSRFNIDPSKAGSLREIVEQVEAEVIHQGLIRTHWNKSQLARELGISRSNLIQKCNDYGLDRKD